MKMNKKVLGIIITVLVVILLVVGIIYLVGGARSVGLNDDIVNENDREGNTNLDSSRTLVLYFSETGNTQRLASIIYNEVGGDLRRIEPVNPYPTGDALYDYTREERDNDERPEFQDLDINLDDYDTIFIGYPIWWYQMPMIMYTLFDEYDFSGKTIIPFNTHEGSGNGETFDDIRELEPNATVLDGLSIRGGNMSSDQSDVVRAWLQELGFYEEN